MLRERDAWIGKVFKCGERNTAKVANYQNIFPTVALTQPCASRASPAKSKLPFDKCSRSFCNSNSFACQWRLTFVGRLLDLDSATNDEEGDDWE